MRTFIGIFRVPCKPSAMPSMPFFTSTSCSHTSVYYVSCLALEALQAMTEAVSSLQKFTALSWLFGSQPHLGLTVCKNLRCCLALADELLQVREFHLQQGGLCFPAHHRRCQCEHTGMLSK